MARGALVDGTTAASFVVLGHMRRHLAGTQISDEIFGVVSFVAAHRDPLLLRSLAQHQQRRFSFGSATGTGQQGIHHQAIPILHQHVALISQFRLAALGLLKQSQISVSGRFMCFIRAFLPMEVHCRIAGVIRFVIIAAFRFLLRLETFQARRFVNYYRWDSLVAVQKD